MNTCDHGHETDEAVRVLPIGGDGNIIVCHKHYLEEIAFRRERIEEGVNFDLPAWESLKIYSPGPGGVAPPQNSRELMAETRRLERLTATAPEMLDILKVLQEQASYARRYRHGEDYCAHRSVTDAIMSALVTEIIAKAEGR